MASKGGKVAVKKPAKKKNGYEMPKAAKPGTILIDSHKKEWKIGKSIGIGGFGEIYSACENSSKIKNLDDYPYVVKLVSSTTIIVNFMNFCNLSSGSFQS